MKGFLKNVLFIVKILGYMVVGVFIVVILFNLCSGGKRKSRFLIDFCLLFRAFTYQVQFDLAFILISHNDSAQTDGQAFGFICSVPSATGLRTARVGMSAAMPWSAPRGI